MRLTMQITVQGLRANFSARRQRAMVALGLMLMLGCVESGLAQTGTPPLNIFKNYFVTGDYVVAGWVPGSPNVGGYAPGTISSPIRGRSAPWVVRSLSGRPPCRKALILLRRTSIGRPSKPARTHSLGRRRSSMVMRSREQFWVTPTRPLRGVRAVARAHPRAQRPCGPTARMSARICRWTWIRRPQLSERCVPMELRSGAPGRQWKQWQHHSFCLGREPGGYLPGHVTGGAAECDCSLRRLLCPE